MNLTITLPDEEVRVLKAKAAARGVSAEQYALEVLEHDLAAADNSFPSAKRFNNLSDLLLSSPFSGANLDLERSKDQPRTVDLFSNSRG
jgi:plasmid stability protein